MRRVWECGERVIFLVPMMFGGLCVVNCRHSVPISCSSVCGSVGGCRCVCGGRGCVGGGRGWGWVGGEWTFV